jgi:hypothetical protein
LVDVGWCVLQRGVLGFDESFDYVGHFVVHFVEEKFVATSGQVFVGDLVSSKEFFFSSILDGN